VIIQDKSFYHQGIEIADEKKPVEGKNT